MRVIETLSVVGFLKTKQQPKKSIMSKKYPFHDDFDPIAKFKLDVSKNGFLKFMNFISGVQYHFKRPEKHTEMKTHTIKVGDHKMKIDVISPKERSGDLPCLYYAHGGGFLLDISPAHIEICSEYAYQANCVVIMPHYRVAINHPFPAGLDDCYAGLEWALNHRSELGIDTSRLILGGESAGGALTASLTQVVRDRNLTTPLFQFLVYPVTSHTCDSRSMEELHDVPGWGAENARISWQKYLKGHDGLPKYASPLHLESFEGLPPAYVEPAEFDCLRDEGIAYANKLRDAGIPVELNITQGTIHAFDLIKSSAITKAAMDKRINVLKAGFAL